jgi:type I restriction enzyme, R subunit
MDEAVDALKKLFDNSREHIEIDRLDYTTRFEQLIDDYSAGGKNMDTFFVELISFARSLSEEEQRSISKNLSEEELAIFDLLTRPNIKLNKSQRAQVKQVAKELLDTLKAEGGWRREQR